MITLLLAQEAGTHDSLPTEEYLLHRIVHGVPEGILDIPPMHAFPMDSNLDIMGARKCITTSSGLVQLTYSIPKLTSEKAVMSGKNSLCGHTTPVSFGNEYFQW